MTTPNTPTAPLIIFDFETTGLSPKQGDRVIEVGAVRIENNRITERFSALMNPLFAITPFIAQYTGITNAMLANANPIYQEMNRFYAFIHGAHLVAHNANFDLRFLTAELAELGITYQGQAVCSMLLAKRVYPKAPSYKLGELIKYAGIQHSGDFHRALYDAEMTAQLWFAMQAQLSEDFGLEQLPFALACKLAKAPQKNLRSLIDKHQQPKP